MDYARTIATDSSLVLDANPLRRLVIIANNSDEDIYLSMGAEARLTFGIPVVAQGGVVIDQPDNEAWIYNGIWTAICASGGKILSVTEINRARQ